MACPAANQEGDDGSDGEEERKLVKKEVIVETGYSDGTIQSKKLVKNVDYTKNAPPPKPPRRRAAEPDNQPGPSSERRQAPCASGSASAPAKPPRRRRATEAAPQASGSAGPSGYESWARRQPRLLVTPPSDVNATFQTQEERRRPRRLNVSDYPAPKCRGEAPVRPGTQMPKPDPPREVTDEELTWLALDLVDHQFQPVDVQKFRRKRKKYMGKGYIPPQGGYHPEDGDMSTISEDPPDLEPTETPEDVVNEIAGLFQGMGATEPLGSTGAKSSSSFSKIRKGFKKAKKRAIKGVRGAASRVLGRSRDTASQSESEESMSCDPCDKLSKTM